MSELLIIDWDDREARVLSGIVSGGVVRVDHVAAAPIEGESAASIADALRPLLAAGHHGRGRIVTLLGGRDVQSRLLRVPPVPSDELPDVVRLRAGTEFPAAEDALVVDFLPIEETNGQPTMVLAARVATKTLATARDVCTKLQLTPESIAMRGCGVAELAKATRQHSQQGVGLIVVRRGSELDLIGTQEAKAAVVRSVPLPGDADAETIARTAAREIRRTIAAISSELGVSDVDTVTWIVGDEDDQQLADHCGRELSRQVNHLEFASLVSGNATWPANAAAFAGMAGTGVALAEKNLAIDFLAPRKPPEKSTPIRTYTLAGSLAALVLLGGGWLMYRSVASLEKAAAADIQETEDIQAEIANLSEEVRQSQDVEQWLATDVNWLDEIDRIAMTLRPEPLDNHDKFQPDRDVLITSLVAKKAPGRRGVGGTVELAGGVRDDEVLEEIEDDLRGPGRQVNPKQLISDSQGAPYVWSFQNDVVVTPPSEDDE